MGSWQNADAFYRIATVLACASIVVTAVYIMRAVGSAIMGPLANKDFMVLKDAAWNENLLREFVAGDCGHWHCTVLVV